MRKTFFVLGCLLASLPSSSRASELVREQLFDQGWKFHRGDLAGAEAPDFPTAESWRILDLPHDWSIEDLPSRDQDELTVLDPTQDSRAGWLFQKGDRLEWKDPRFNDRGWQEAQIPSAWKEYSGFGWYRKHLTLTPDGRDQVLNLSTLGGADEVYFNGVLVGKTGEFPPAFDAYWGNVYQRQRTYQIPANLIQAGENLLAIRLYSPVPGAGGIYDLESPVRRIGPFDPGASLGGTDTGHTVGGTGWYRKSFVLDSSQKDLLTSIRFDGAMVDSEVWINGHFLGQHHYGYTSFVYDLTDYLQTDGSPNVLAVRVRNLGKNSRWYNGSGLIRHTWLTRTSRLHFGLWGISASTEEIFLGSAKVRIQVSVQNQTTRPSSAVVRLTLKDPQGSPVLQKELSARTVSKGADFTFNLDVPSPKLWSIDTPQLYRAQVQLLNGERLKDSAEIQFGIRTVSADSTHGFRLNGQSLKLKGGNLHQDNGPLGSKAIDRAEERKVEILKSLGYNAIRTSHNPPAPALLDAADRLGMLILEEAFDQWQKPKTADDYHTHFQEEWRRDLRSMILRDRNHPSVVIWSIGNEIPERATESGAKTAQELSAFVRSLDPTRPITSAYNSVSEKADPYFASIDIAGYNYNPERYLLDHQRDPARVIVGTESYPKEIDQYWKKVQEMPWVIGDFVWTSMDYLGESGIGHADLDNELHSYLKAWPWYEANCGDVDLCGFKKPQSFYRDVIWGQSSLEMLVHAPLPEGRTEVVGEWGWPNEEPHWTWPGAEGKILKVSVFSRSKQVRLFLNKKLIGEKQIPEDGSMKATFEVPYEPGELRVVALDNGTEKSDLNFKTTGRATALRLSVDRKKIHPGPNDLAYVKVEAVDDQGQRVPYEESAVQFQVQGAGQIELVCSSNPKAPASFQSTQRDLYQGQALVIVKPKGKTGRIDLKASMPSHPEIQPGQVKIRVH